jgi:hypothetical protein
MEHLDMTKQLLDTVCDTLKAANLVSGEQELCVRWLAKSECYMRTLRFHGAEPSAEALATLGSKLGYYATELARLGDDTSAHWSSVLNQLRAQTQAALERRVRARWQSVCAHQQQLRENTQ